MAKEKPGGKQAGQCLQQRRLGCRWRGGSAHGAELPKRSLVIMPALTFPDYTQAGIPATVPCSRGGMKNRPLGALYNYANGKRRRCAHARAHTHHPVNTLIKLILHSSAAQTPFGEAPPRQPEPVWALQIDCQEFHRAAARWREVAA